MTPYSSHCDLFCREESIIEPGQVVPVPAGVWIDRFDVEQMGSNLIPELQVRCRSSFPLKRHLMIPNGVGTIDIDYPDEIKVLLYNFGHQTVILDRGERIGQMSLSLVHRIEGAQLIDSKRAGGFGSTGR
jgi:dUTP pyrophosphatase